MTFTYFLLNIDEGTTQRLKSTFKDFPELKCLGEINNTENSLNCVLKLEPILLFIDIDNNFPNSSDNDVFSFCQEINEHSRIKPLYIAISKDTTKAYTALKNQFFDYLIKPTTELDLRKSILKLKRYLTECS